MNIEQLKALAADKPFRPFELETIGGNYIRINASWRLVFPPSPEFDLIFIYASDGVVHHITADGINSYSILPIDK